jgi:glycine betaine/proline transport system permease protein
VTALSPSIRPAALRVGVDRRTGMVLGAVAAVFAFLVFRGQFTLPHDDQAPLFSTLNGVRDWVSENQSTHPFFLIVIHPIRDAIGAMVGAFQDVLHGLTWPAVVVIAALIGAIGGGWRLAALGATGFLSLGALGLWSESLDTIALVRAARDPHRPKPAVPRGHHADP